MKTMSKQTQFNWDVVVVGGGPAGFFAAIRCAELNSNLYVFETPKGVWKFSIYK
jgi:flavin-dependent dehydrogenase